MIKPFPSVKCFDMTLALDLVTDLRGQTESSGKIASHLSFLPAPATWIEYSLPGMESAPFGYLLVERSKRLASVIQFVCVNGGFAASPLPDIPLLEESAPEEWALDAAVAMVDSLGSSDDDALRAAVGHAHEIHAALAIINSPKIIERTTNQPSKKLAKALGSACRNGAPYQLQEWHEIRLEIGAHARNSIAPEDAAGIGQSKTERVLHFCRQHIRVRLGRLEIVRAHFRGNPAKGISRATYTVA